MASHRLASLQQCRAELDTSQVQVTKLLAMVRLTTTRLLQIDGMLAHYFAQTKNPFKLVCSRMLHPGKMRKDRKFIEAELKALQTELRELPAPQKKSPMPPSSIPSPQVAQVGQVAEGARHHVIISGTGRAGTTFLMELLTALGMETGYQHYSDLIDQNAQAGLERDIRKKDAPYIIKNPRLCEYLGEVLETGGVIVDHAFIPVRDLAEAARSRARVVSQADPSKTRVKGGFWEAGDANQQEIVLAQKLSQLIVTLTRHDVPATLLSFPRLVEDAPYLYEKLTPVLQGMSFPLFEEVYHRVARPDLVNRDL